MTTDDAAQRAKLRALRMTVRKSRLGEPEVDVVPTFGPHAISLVYQLTVHSYALAGVPLPDYTRAAIPWRFVPRPKE